MCMKKEVLKTFYYCTSIISSTRTKIRKVSLIPYQKAIKINLKGFE